MFIMRFTERPYVAYTEDQVRSSFRSSVRLTFSNAHFDPHLGSDLYNEYLDEYELSEQAGFDGLMLNEHHNTPTCMGATMNLEAAILARITKKPKIVLLGNPLPIFENPLRLAEELAEIDMISRGRLVSGFVRGTGIESWATNTNPVHNRERFEEAHDLIIKTWTTPGPFRWEGKHYHFRVVNPFQTPLQKPHPPIWIPGVGSPETLEWCARHHYPYIYLETDPEVTVSMTDLYSKAAAECGYQPGPQNFGYLWRIHVQDTDEKAAEVGKGFLIGNAGIGRRRDTTRAKVRNGCWSNTSMRSGRIRFTAASTPRDGTRWWRAIASWSGVLRRLSRRFGKASRFFVQVF
jgi:alkanesulfonate monooxygenase SsuD/methylene tetrahydromethanopterin reductase-like flavin-dependent oxidoreductase (luciferase family)